MTLVGLGIGESRIARVQHHAIAVGALALMSLAGCAVAPEPLTPVETVQRIEADLTGLAETQPLLAGPLSLHGAMARALLHNPEARVQAMEQDLALRQTEVARLGLLPALTGRYGVDMRSNVQAASSRSVATGRESLTASTSNDRTRRVGNLSVAWHMLDFGVSYYGAKQQADRALIAHERRRKAVHAALADVRGAWWRAVAAERALARLEPLLARVEEALEDSERLAAQQMQSSVEALRYQRGLLEAVTTLERQRRESRLAKFELARLIGLPPTAEYRLAIPPATLEPRRLAVSVDELAGLALSHRPELREGQLEERIAVREVKKAMLRVLPGLELQAGAHADSNSFLVNHDWLSLGVAVTANLTELFTGPTAIDAARTGQELAAARREALSMAVLTQLFLALVQFEEAREHHATAAKIAGIEQRIVDSLRSAGRHGAVDRLITLRGEVQALLALLARDLSFAEVEAGFGQIFLAVGADVVAVEQVKPTLEDVEAAVAATEEAWGRGEIAMGAWPGVDVRPGE